MRAAPSFRREATEQWRVAFRRRTAAARADSRSSTRASIVAIAPARQRRLRAAAALRQPRPPRHLRQHANVIKIHVGEYNAQRACGRAAAVLHRHVVLHAWFIWIHTYL